MNNLPTLYLSPSDTLDIPTGFDAVSGILEFSPDIILTLAAMKRELLLPCVKADLFIADLGIPSALYQKFNIRYPAQFNQSGILKVQKAD